MKLVSGIKAVSAKVVVVVFSGAVPLHSREKNTFFNILLLHFKKIPRFSRITLEQLSYNLCICKDFERRDLELSRI